MIYGDRVADAPAHIAMESVHETTTTTDALHSLSSPVHSPAFRTRLRIRTLPRECNPTPHLSKANTWSSASKKTFIPRHATSSPKTPRGSSTPISSNNLAESEMRQKADPFDDLTEAKMRILCKAQDLECVVDCTISIDSRKQSTELIGQLLPSLKRLQFCNSFIASFRDLGTSLRVLKILDARECGIKHLDGISALANLEELYLSYNDITEIDYCFKHDELRVLDLEGNKIADENQVQHLAFCTHLRDVHLRKNPMTKLPHYRQLVVTMIPQVEILDGARVTEADRYSLSTDTKDEISDQKEYQSHKVAVLASPGNRDCRDEAFPRKREEASTYYGSTLTHGTHIVFAGNPTNSLRRHRNEIESDYTSNHFADGDNISDTEHPFHRPKNQQQNSVQSGDCFSFIDRRELITDTLDRANEFQSEQPKEPLVTNSQLVDSQQRQPHTLQKSLKELNMAVADVVGDEVVDNNTKDGLPGSDVPQPLPKFNRTSSSGYLGQELKSPDTGTFDHTIDCKSDTAASKLGITALSLHEMYSSFKECKVDKVGGPRPDDKSDRDGKKTSQAEEDNSDEGDGNPDRKAYPGKVSSKPMFNIFHGLRAIDQWNEQFEEEGPKSISQNCLNLVASPKSLSKHVGPANFESNETLVAIIRGECTLEIDLKTRDGFRRYFGGMDATRLEDVLKVAFSDHSKIARRLLLMKGFLRDDASTN
uniref:Uncharacterized protein AlNc14C2G368 n=1 Tax=Albugo laibachii Nc14 TaxID=890382 RepID=F0VZN0_9STRA|nr:conserved hypothetical protein [Albugo laibachii Nc14]|eukprot:CCA14260.1 conserved hypothetical protein [Albugo laibachii Nc14]